MNCDELEIDKLAVYRGEDSCRDFVYVETKPEKAIGIYNYSEDHFNEQMDKGGFCYEEYGLFDSIPISKEEYDDGATLIDGRIVETVEKAVLRVRYLSKYNFVIASQLSPINSQAVDDKLQLLLGGMLKGLRNMDDLLGLIESLPIHKTDI